VANPRGPYSVYFKRKQVDKTIKRPLARETRQLFKAHGVTKDHNRPLIVTLEPGDVISFRLKGTRQRVSVPIAHAYNLARFAAARSARVKKRR